MSGGVEGALLATVREEVLDLRRDAAGVLTALLIRILGEEPQVAKRLAAEALTTITATGSIERDAGGQFQRLRAEVLALRRDVAVVMAKLFLAAGRSEAEVGSVILSPLGLRRAERATSDDRDD